MTERKQGASARAGAIALASAALVFAVVLVAMAARMREGADPALRGAPPRALPARRVLVRRVLERRVVVVLPAKAAAPASSASQQVAAAGAFEGASPLTRTS